MSQANEKVILSWETAFSLVTNRFFLYDILKALAWTAGIVALLLTVTFAMAGNLGSLWGVFPVLGIILAAIFVLILLIALVLFGNRYPTRFTMTDRAVYWSGRSKEAHRASRLAMLAGILGGKPSVAGAGLLAATGNSGFLPWKSVGCFKAYPAERVITIMNTWRVVVRLYCTAENYQVAVESVRRLALPQPKK